MGGGGGEEGGGGGGGDGSSVDGSGQSRKPPRPMPNATT
eukprot:COSAG06_NODE_67051_length_250_cov_0.493506_1_plen_38_part_01